MANTDLSSSRKPHVHTRVSLRQPLRCGFAIVLCSCLFAGAAQCRARAPQDVAEAARQERARKETKKQKHVYTDEDLRRAKILTPDDEARVEAKRLQQPAAIEEQAQVPVDAGVELAQLPLGDIARRYRDAKRAAQMPDPFHLPFDEPVFAAPIISVPKLEPPRPSFSPVHPNVGPAQPNAVVAPAMPSPAPLRRLDPFTRRLAPVAPAAHASASRPAPARAVPQPNPSRDIAAPRLESPKFAPVPAAPAARPYVSRPAPVVAARPNLSSKIAPPKFEAPKFSPLPAEPNIAPAIAPSTPRPSVAASIAPPSVVAKTSSSLHTVTVQPGDSLWKLAQQNLGRGSRWQEFLAANPGIVDPARITAGTEIVVPAKITGLKSDLKVTVKQGDTLSRIAQSTYGRAAAWRCIAQANPEIADANRIYAGQQLLLPFSCNQ